MKNKLTKIYNIFKQIENMKGSTGWDQTDVFYYFYENNQFINCCKLLYGLFCENKNLKPSVFGTTLMELRKYANGFSVIYEFGNSEYPILVATFDRNGKHQISGTVKVEETSISEEKEITFVDGINVDSDEIDNSIFNLETMVTEFIDLTDSEAESRVYEGKNVSYHDDNDELLTINTPEQLEAVIELYGANSNRFFFFPETKEMFRINGEIPESLESLEEVKLFLDYLYDDCNLVGAFHPDDSLDNYTDEHGDDLFNQQQVEKYNKYLDDMFELDADGDSEFVKAGYEDIYDYCMNYRNDNHGINENYPIKLQYGCTYVRRDGIISGQLSQNTNEEGNLTNVFHDSENGLDYQINGKLISGEYNRKNAEDLIAENFDYTSYLEDGKLSVGISFESLPTKYPSSLNFVSDGLGRYVSYVIFEIGENSSEELRNFGLDVDWNNSTNSWKITTNNQYEHEVFYIDENVTLDDNGEIDTEFSNMEIEGTLPEYEAEQLMEIVSNEDKIEVSQPIKIKKFEYICNDCGEDFESKYKQTGCASCNSWNIREI